MCAYVLNTTHTHTRTQQVVIDEQSRVPSASASLVTIRAVSLSDSQIQLNDSYEFTGVTFETSRLMRVLNRLAATWPPDKSVVCRFVSGIYV